MSKKIVIVGGGISGLSLLHYLNKKYSGRNDVAITLLEKSERVGGTIQTIKRSGALFECGANGFLNSSPATLELVNELGLSGELIKADPAAKIRYITYNQKLLALPGNPVQLLGFKPFNFTDKLKILREPFIPAGINHKETVYEFGARRLGPRFADIFLDPMVKGVFGGDARELQLSAAFPRIHELEQRYGSLILAMFALRRSKKGQAGQPKGELCSFRQGLSQLVDQFVHKYQTQIHCHEAVESVVRSEGKYRITTSKQRAYHADQLFITVPAYAAAPLLGDIHARLATLLKEIPYSSIGVAGLLFGENVKTRLPSGFGYLIPSMEKNNVLGVLFSSQIFANRASKNDVLVRCMIGGVTTDDTDERLLEQAREELKRRFGISESPKDAFVCAHPKAIPQYTVAYTNIMAEIESIVSQLKDFDFVSNFKGGVALNDCVKNAKAAVDKVNF